MKILPKSFKWHCFTFTFWCSQQLFFPFSPLCPCNFSPMYLVTKCKHSQSVHQTRQTCPAELDNIWRRAAIRFNKISNEEHKMWGDPSSCGQPPGGDPICLRWPSSHTYPCFSTYVTAVWCMGNIIPQMFFQLLDPIKCCITSRALVSLYLLFWWCKVTLNVTC